MRRPRLGQDDISITYQSSTCETCSLIAYLSIYQCLMLRSDKSLHDYFYCDFSREVKSKIAITLYQNKILFNISDDKWISNTKYEKGYALHIVSK